MARLRKDSSASYLAQVLSTDETLDLLRSVSQPEDVIEVLWAYVCMASLFLRNDLRKFQDTLTSLDLSHIPWGNEIRRDIFAEMTPTTFTNVEYEEISKTENVGTATAIAQGHAQQVDRR